MTDQEKNTTEEKVETTVSEEVPTETKKEEKGGVPAEVSSNAPRKPRSFGGDKGGARGGQRGGRPQRGGRRGKGRGDERQRSEFDQKIISLRRVSRVVAGGRRFSFSAAMVVGDRKGRVGVGVGKGVDTALAMDKALRDGKKNMIKVKMTDTNSIPHDVDAKYVSSVVSLIPSPARGIVAGSSVRTILELAGVTDVTSKLQSRSKNKINNARATIEALKQLRG